MKTKLKKYAVNWLKRDEVEIKIVDMSRKTLYRMRIRVDDHNKLAEALLVLEQKYGLNIEEVNRIIEEKKREERSWWD